MTRRLLLVAALYLLAACHHSDSSGPNTGPTLSNLRVSELARTRTGGTFTLAADVLDLDGDILGGRCVMVANIGTVTERISNLMPEVHPNGRSGTVSGGATYSGVGFRVAGSLTVVDRAGHPSNALPFSFEAEGVQHRPTGGPASLAPSEGGWQLTARI